MLSSTQMSLQVLDTHIWVTGAMTACPCARRLAEQRLCSRWCTHWAVVPLGAAVEVHAAAVLFERGRLDGHIAAVGCFAAGSL